MSLTEPIHSACSRNHRDSASIDPSPMGPWGHGATSAQGVCERHVHSPDQLKVPWSHPGDVQMDEATPLSLDGLFHGKSENEMADFFRATPMT